MDEFKKGDIVILKSGGPVMTIQDIGDYSMSDDIKDGVLCIWFDGNHPSERVFNKESLKIYED